MTDNYGQTIIYKENCVL